MTHSRSALRLAKARALWGFLTESAVTGEQVAQALGRGRTYVSNRRNVVGDFSWTLDDLDVIAGLVGMDPLDFHIAVLERAAVLLRRWEDDHAHGLPSPLDDLPCPEDSPECDGTRQTG